MATANKKVAPAGVSAIDRIKAENSVGDYKLTDTLVISAPTFEQSKAFDAADTFDEKMAAWIGDDAWGEFQAELDKLEVQLVPLVLQDFMGHFFGAEAAAKLAELGKVDFDKVEIPAE